MLRPELTEMELAVLEFIKTCLRTNFLPPTRREIVKATQLCSTSSVDYNLHRLAEKGYIALLPDTARGIKLIGDTLEQRILTSDNIALIIEALEMYSAYSRKAKVVEYKERMIMLILDLENKLREIA